MLGKTLMAAITEETGINKYEDNRINEALELLNTEACEARLFIQKVECGYKKDDEQI
jgi:hypothetical protein